MLFQTLQRWVPCALATLAMQATAAPMGFKGSTMAMGDASPGWRELYVNYAFTPRDALGASVLAMRSDNGVLHRDSLELSYTRLGRRWNLPHAQANLWLLAGIGALRANGASHLLLTPGVQADYETTRVYLSASARLYRAGNLKHDYGALRAGFSFYETDYEQTQPWLVLEARRMRGLSATTEITPMLRLINKSWFAEAGISNHRQARLNFMHIF
jgi:hypothetical protein